MDGCGDRRNQLGKKPLTNGSRPATISKSTMRIHVIKALWRSTSKTMLIRAKNPDQAIMKAAKLKECVDCMGFEFIETRPDDRGRGV